MNKNKNKNTFKNLIKIDLVSKKVEILDDDEVEEGYLKLYESKDGWVFDYEEYIIVDIGEEG